MTALKSADMLVTSNATTPSVTTGLIGACQFFSVRLTEMISSPISSFSPLVIVALFLVAGTVSRP